MEFLSVSPQSLRRAAGILRSGGLVAFPTETVYGLGVDAYNPDALAKIFEAKGRPRFDPLIIHIAAIGTLEDVTDLSLINEKTRRKLFLLAENLWPGPLSLVLPKNKKIPGLATAGLSTAAIRFPDHGAAQELISLSTGAVAAPSANPFGALSPTRAEHVRDKLGEKIDMILDGGTARIGLESTVLDITGEKIKILRYGGTPKEKIENLIGRIIAGDAAANPPASGGLVSPGLLKSHYAPRASLSVFSNEGIFRLPWEPGAAYLFFDSHSRYAWLEALPQKPPAKTVIMVLSPSSEVLQAASRLFEILHELDNSGISRIFAQLAPEDGLGEAINDRLQRASVIN